MNNIDLLKEYFSAQNIPYWDRGTELVSHCPLGDCDKDSKGTEGHFYIKQATGQWDCKKSCGSGNIITLAQKLKESGDSYLSDALQKTKKQTTPRFTTLVENCHKALPEETRRYLREKRGWSDDIINQHKIGLLKYWGTDWITIPIKTPEGKYVYFKLREDYTKGGKRKITYPAGSDEAQLYDYDTLQTSGDKIILVEGEPDALLLRSLGLSAITSSHGAGTFKDDWLQHLPKDKAYYICFDTDDAGRKGAEKVLNKLYNYGIEKLHVISLPIRQDSPEQKVDITDYLVEMGGTIENLFSTYAEPYPPKIDTSKFKEMSFDDVKTILSLTIKEDDNNKVATFCALINAYTDNAQFNVSFNGPSSGGKSHTAIESSNLFPSDDVIKLGSVSPTAFFHEQGVYDKERNVITIDLSRKILIFLDMPHNMLLERLRPLLSHDEKVMQVKITDKNQKGGNRTKTVEIIGYPSVIFCTAGLNIDEQEATRFLLLSPEMSQSKIKQGVQQAIRKNADHEEFSQWLNSDNDRQLLMERIRAIKHEKISDIKIENIGDIQSRFLDGKKRLKPKHQRDVKRVLSLVKASALLNLFFRKREGTVIIANEKDIQEAFDVWEKISVSQELGIPPYLHDIYVDVILSKFNEKNGITDGKYYSDIAYERLSRKEIQKKHFEVYGRPINDYTLRQNVLPMLETAGLIDQEPDANDRRFTFVLPILEYELHSATESGVKTSLPKVEEDMDEVFNQFQTYDK